MSLSSFENILRYDLFPFLFTNLVGLIGVWMGFDETELINDIRRRRMNLPGSIKSSVEFAACVVFWEYGDSAVE